MPAVKKKLLTAEEFFRLPEPPDGSRQELVRGEVVTMAAPGFEHCDIQAQILMLIRLFLRDHPIGRAVAETGVRTTRRPDSVRGPDVSFWSYERLPKRVRPKGYPQVPADLCVEVRSPGDSMLKLRAKAREYLNSGVKMVWIVDPKDESVTVYRRPGKGTVLSDGEAISGEDVLPGFECVVSDFFAS
jgi:Uma2 family endonuclease